MHSRELTQSQQPQFAKWQKMAAITICHATAQNMICPQKCQAHHCSSRTHCGSFRIAGCRSRIGRTYQRSASMVPIGCTVGRNSAASQVPFRETEHYTERASVRKHNCGFLGLGRRAPAPFSRSIAALLPSCVYGVERHSGCNAVTLFYETLVAGY